MNTQFHRRRQVRIQHFITLIARGAAPFTKFRGKGFRPRERVDRPQLYPPYIPYDLGHTCMYTACNFTLANTHAFCILPVTRHRHHPVKYGRDHAVVMSHTRVRATPRGELYQLPCLRVVHDTSSWDRRKILRFTWRSCCRTHLYRDLRTEEKAPFLRSKRFLCTRVFIFCDT